MPGRTKNNHAVALDEKRLAGLGIAPHTISPLPDLECPEPRQLYRLATQNGLGNLLNHEIKSLANRLPWEIGPSPVAPGVLDNVGSIQWTSLFSCVFFRPWIVVCFFARAKYL